MNRRKTRLAVGAAAVAILGGAMLVVRPWTLLGEEAGDRSTSTLRPDAIDATDSDGSASRALAGQPRAGGTAADALPAAVDFTAVDRELDLHGTVVDATGVPIAGATLVAVTYPFRRASILAIARRDDAVIEASTRSANDGTFALRLRRGASAALRVSAKDFAAVELPARHAGARLRVVMKKGVTLLVDAVDEDGRPVNDAKFRLFRSDHLGDAAFEVRAQTGPDGSARFEQLTPSVGAYLALESSTCGDVGWKEVTLPVTGEMTLRLELPAGRAVTGRVTDADTRAPIPDARVGMNWTLNRAVRTDADGRYILAGWTGKGVSDLHVLAEGYGRGHAIVGTVTSLDFALSKGDNVAGRVVGPDGKPIAGATIAAIGSTDRVDGQQHISTAEATSGTDGRFALSSLRRDLPHTLVVMGVGFGRTLLDFDPRPGAPGVIDLGDVRVPAARTLAGRVVTSEGTPVPSARVECSGANGDRGRLRVGRTPIPDAFYGREETDFTDDLGRFRFADLSPGAYSIGADARGAAVPSREIAIVADVDPSPVELRLPSGRSFRVSVVDENDVPVPWARVAVGGSVIPLDVHATATFTLIGRRPSIVVAAWDGMGGTDERRFVRNHLEYEIEATDRELRVVLKSGIRTHGRVVTSDGTGVGRVRVECVLGETYVNSTWTDADSAFDMTVPKGGPYRLRLVGSALPGRGGATTVETGLAGEVDGVLPGAVDVVIRALPVARDLSQDVSVVDADGQPVAGAVVSATWSDSIGRSADLRTDSRGRIVMTGLPGRSCWFEAASADSRDDWLDARRRVTVPTSGTVELRLRRGIRIRGTVLIPAGVAMPIRIDVSQKNSDGVEHRTIELTDPRAATFSVLLDPEDGVLLGLEATAGPEDAPTHTATAEGSALAAGDVVLTLTAVK